MAVHQHSECIAADVEVSGKDIVLGELVGDLCIEISEGIASVDLVGPVPGIDYCKHRQSQSLSPGSSNAHIERCPVFPERAFKLKTSVNEAECEGSVIVIEVSISGGDVHDRRHLGAISCRETAFVEVHASDDIRVEGREEPEKMAHGIDRHAVKKEKVVASVSSVHIKTGKQLGS